MRIDEIIAERETQGTKDSLELLNQEFDGEFLDPNGNKYQWAMQFHKASVVMNALQYFNKPNYNAGTAIKAAVQDMYPDSEYVTGKKQTKDRKSKKKSKSRKGSKKSNRRPLNSLPARYSYYM